MRPIDADALKKHWNKQDVKCGEYTAFHFLESIDEQPTIEERKAGRWTSENACEFCGFQPWYENDIHTLSFCPNCGADVRGENNEAIENTD